MHSTNHKPTPLLWALLLTAASALFASCEVDFSPNAEWKNVPIVYCVIDQDDDTTWARVERCYLSNDGLFNYGQVADSINYAEGAIRVTIIAYNGSAAVDSIDLEYTLRQRDTGTFASGLQPIYGAATKGWFKEDLTYAISVRSTADDSLLAISQQVSLIKELWDSQRNRPMQHILEPSYTVIFSGDTLGYFNFSSTNAGQLCCLFKWEPLVNARLYQPVIRFFFEIDGAIVPLDIKCNSEKKNNYLYQTRSSVLSSIKLHLQDDPRPKRYIPHVDIYLTCCSEELNAYMSTASQSVSLNQDYSAYTNIKGGVGVFASRRTHIYKGMPSDASTNPSGSNTGLAHLLKELDVGIEFIE